jgi:hypothetical protein
VVSAWFIEDLSNPSTPFRKFLWAFSAATSSSHEANCAKAFKKIHKIKMEFIINKTTSCQKMHCKQTSCSNNNGIIETIKLTIFIGKWVLLLRFGVLQFGGIEFLDASEQSLLGLLGLYVWN